MQSKYRFVNSSWTMDEFYNLGETSSHVWFRNQNSSLSQYATNMYFLRKSDTFQMLKSFYSGKLPNYEQIWTPLLYFHWIYKKKWRKWGIGNISITENIFPF